MFCCLRTCLNGGQLRKPTAAAHRLREPDVHLDAAHMGADVILLSHQLRVTGTGGVLATAPLVQSKSYFEVKIQQSGSWSIGLATRQADLGRKWGGGDRESWCLCSDNATRHNDEEFGPVVANCTQPTLSSSKSVTTTTNGILNNSAAAAAGLIAIEDLQEDLVMTTGNSELTTVEELIKAPQRDFPDEGDIVGVAFDHVELNFYFNGKNLEVPFRNVRGAALFPVIYVGNGAILDIILDNFSHGPPSGFERILLEQSLL
ncbi:SPRY domain-containing protein 7 [Drosophila sulfurigaster albostrigata]|uniref:SPRY domain-containing protein 7 n=1 Tax=Drosophila nasuta TaxID=42062 RepID=UPI00295E40D8|nr:SPRY domain-containing protein 7 [Drosophila nasuta]XP_062122416.1 SPRY domain-containing protein 7 [Drosophila sulfurigaster albostrigata]